MRENSIKQERTVVDGTTIQTGTPLVDKHGNFVGIVKEIQEKGFLVDRSDQHFEDLFVPYWVCLDDGPGQLRMEIGQDEVNGNVWRTPEKERRGDGETR